MNHTIETISLLALVMVESIIGERWNSQELATLSTLAFVIGKENGIPCDAVLYGLVKSLESNVEQRVEFRKTANSVAGNDDLNAAMISECARTFGRI